MKATLLGGKTVWVCLPAIQKDGRESMCLDFRDLNKSSPKADCLSCSNSHSGYATFPNSPLQWDQAGRFLQLIQAIQSVGKSSH